MARRNNWISMALLIGTAGEILGARIAMAQSGQPAQPANSLTACEKQRGFEHLFDGTREGFASHFVAYKRDDSTTDPPLAATWTVDPADSALHSGQVQPNLRSRERFSDFDLRAEYRNDGEAGFFYRATLKEEEIWMSGQEYTLEDAQNVGNRKVHAGSLYDMFKPDSGHYHAYATGRWNQARIVAIGDSVEHWLNGVKVLGYRYHSPAWWNANDRSKWSDYPGYGMKVPGRWDGGPLSDGYLGLQANWGGKWSLRSLRVSRKPVFYDESISCPGLSTPLRGTAPQGARPPFSGMLRRAGNSVIIATGITGVLQARLVPADGRRALDASWIGDAEIGFPGAVPRGLYFAVLRTRSEERILKAVLP
ncbi:MAG: DUF1080 domain-containing protein [Fibrobacteria bacterium]